VIILYIPIPLDNGDVYILTREVSP